MSPQQGRGARERGEKGAHNACAARLQRVERMEAGRELLGIIQIAQFLEEDKSS